MFEMASGRWAAVLIGFLALYCPLLAILVGGYQVSPDDVVPEASEAFLERVYNSGSTFNAATAQRSRRIETV